MTADAAPRLRRVWLAHDALGLHPRAFELGLRLASRHQAELANLVIEDLELLRAASLPFVHEILFGGERSRPLQDAVKGQTEARALQLQRELTVRAQAVRWSLRMIQAECVGPLLDELAGDEVLVLGRKPRQRWSDCADDAPVVLLHTDASSGQRVQVVAAELDELEQGALQPRGRHALIWVDTAHLVALLRENRPRLLVLPAHALGPEELVRLLQLAQCPVVLVS